MWTIKFEKSARKSLEKLDKQIQVKILNYLDQETLLNNPKAFGKPLLHSLKGSGDIGLVIIE